MENNRQDLNKERHPAFLLTPPNKRQTKPVRCAWWIESCSMAWAVARHSDELVAL